ncbi:serine hydrolase [Streptomyces cirratus]
MVAARATPGGVLVCGTATGERTVISAGVVSPYTNPKAPDENTVYDLASLTKVTATWPLVGRAVADGLLDLDTPGEGLPAADGRPHAQRRSHHAPAAVTHPAVSRPPPASTSTTSPPGRCTS